MRGHPSCEVVARVRVGTPELFVTGNWQLLLSKVLKCICYMYMTKEMELQLLLVNSITLVSLW